MTVTSQTIEHMETELEKAKRELAAQPTPQQIALKEARSAVAGAEAALAQLQKRAARCASDLEYSLKGGNAGSFGQFYLEGKMVEIMIGRAETKLAEAKKKLAALGKR